MTKAAVLIEPGKPLVIEEVVVDKPGPHEVRIRTAACGLCHSDLHFIEGAYPHPLPAIPGHEAAGIVEAVGSEVRTVKVGDAVVTRSEEHTSELQSLMRISYAVFCLKKKTTNRNQL